jgi:hypothetical protein
LPRPHFHAWKLASPEQLANRYRVHLQLAGRLIYRQHAFTHTFHCGSKHIVFQ